MTHSVRLRDADAYAEGGLVKSAGKLADAGRYGDDMVIHINSDEYNQLRKHWGEPTINPDTGMPEFFLSGLKSWLKDNPWVSPVASTLGSAVLGPWVGSMLGGILPESISGLAGNALTGGAIGALTGGGLSGGLQGALLGGTISPYIGNYLAGTGLGQSLGLQQTQTLGGLLGLGGAGGNPTGVASNGLRSEAAMDAAKNSGSQSILGNLFGGSGGGSSGKSNLPLLLGGLAVAGAVGSAFNKPKGQQAPPGFGQQPGSKSPLQTIPWQRGNMSGSFSDVDYYTYGQRPAQQFFTNNKLPTVQPYAEGGGVDYDPTGEGDMDADDKHPSNGRSDKIQALVSPGEYIMDAETVSLLGDGNTDAGVQALDGLRENLRKHKGAALAKGKISPDAKSPLEYVRSA